MLYAALFVILKSGGFLFGPSRANRRAARARSSRASSGIAAVTLWEPLERLLLQQPQQRFLLAQVASAQNAPSDCNQAAGAEPEQNTTQLQQAKIERTLQGAGLTDIETAPTAFLVRAKNSEGKPVVMVLDPTSMTTAIVETGQSATDDTTTGSAK